MKVNDFGDYLAKLSINAHQPGIAKCLKILNIININDNLTSQQRQYLAEAHYVSNLGTCRDQALTVIGGMLDGATKKNIERKISSRREKMYLFHGLIQGPCQKLLGNAQSSKLTFQEYGISLLSTNIKQKLCDSDQSWQKLLQFLMSKPIGTVFVVNFSSEKIGQHHEVGFQLKSKGNILAWEDGKWFKQAIKALPALMNEYSKLGYISAEIFKAIPFTLPQSFRRIICEGKYKPEPHSTYKHFIIKQQKSDNLNDCKNHSPRINKSRCVYL